jgi:hypothetical protein
MTFGVKWCLGPYLLSSTVPVNTIQFKTHQHQDTDVPAPTPAPVRLHKRDSQADATCILSPATVRIYFPPYTVSGGCRGRRYLGPPQARACLARRGRPGGPFGMLLTANIVVNRIVMDPFEGTSHKLTCWICNASTSVFLQGIPPSD